MKHWLLLFAFFPLLTAAQTRHECWLKTTVSHRFSDRWSAGIEFQYRRQANYRNGEQNIAGYPLGTVARAWISRLYNKGWSAVISPAGYFLNEDIMNKQGQISQVKEFRISAGIVKTINFHQFKNKNRFLIDERILSLNDPSRYSQLRFRLQNSFAIPLLLLKKENHISWVIAQEYFLKTEKRSLRFDQERLYTAVHWAHNLIETGIGYQWVLQKNSGDYYHRNQLYFQLNFSI